MNDLIRLHSDGNVYDMNWDAILMTQQQQIEVMRGEFDLVFERPDEKPLPQHR